MTGQERLIALGLVLAAIVLLGMTGCAVNSAYQFRVGGYCNRAARDSDQWVKCDMLREER